MDSYVFFFLLLRFESPLKENFERKEEVCFGLCFCLCFIFVSVNNEDLVDGVLCPIKMVLCLFKKKKKREGKKCNGENSTICKA